MNRKYTTKEEAREQHLKQMREWYQKNKPKTEEQKAAVREEKRKYYKLKRTQCIQRAVAWYKKNKVI